jgi:Uma2 family endonuclease
MAAVATLPKPEHLVILEDVSWETYERLLAENNPGRGKRFTYDNGTLQIMVLSYRREHPNRKLALIVELVSMEWELDIEATGSITIKRPDLYKGFEPDSCFYIQNAGALRGKSELDFTVDPAPDLVIEVDITTDSMNKFPIFAAVGVPEVWRFDGERVSIHLARESGYVEAAVSQVMKPLTAELLTSFLRTSFEEDRPQWIRRLRKWAREARPSTH